MICHAKQYSDQMVCGRCGLQWDVGDISPPDCKNVPKPAPAKDNVCHVIPSAVSNVIDAILRSDTPTRVVCVRELDAPRGVQPTTSGKDIVVCGMDYAQKKGSNLFDVHWYNKIVDVMQDAHTDRPRVQNVLLAVPYIRGDGGNLSDVKRTVAAIVSHMLPVQQKTSPLAVIELTVLCAWCSKDTAYDLYEFAVRNYCGSLLCKIVTVGQLAPA